MTGKARRYVLLFAMVFLGVCRGADAGSITEYSSLSAFGTAVGVPLTNENFTFGTTTQHFPIPTGILNSATNLVVSNGSPILPGDIQPGVTYSTPIGTGDFFNIDSGGGYPGGFLDEIGTSGPSTALTTTSNTAVNGFGLSTNSLMGTQFTLTINFTSGPAQTFVDAVPPTESLSFFGFVSSDRHPVGVALRQQRHIYLRH